MLTTCSFLSELTEPNHLLIWNVSICCSLLLYSGLVVHLDTSVFCSEDKSLSMTREADTQLYLYTNLSPFMPFNSHGLEYLQML